MQNLVTLNKIHIYYILTICVLFSTKIAAQDYEKIKKSDIVYIDFKETPYQQMFLPQRNCYGDCYFIFEEYYKFKHIIFYQKPHLFEERNEKKSFLKKNKDLLIDYTFLINMFSYVDAKQLLLNKKKIFLISNTYKRCFSIKLKEVKVLDYNLYPIE
jgi:hypothetical protein